MSTHAAREHSSSYNSDLDVSENEGKKIFKTNLDIYSCIIINLLLII